MAKRKKLDVDGFDLDNELNFDDFNLDDINSEINPEVKNKKSRSPAMDVFKGTIAGTKDKFKDPSFLAKITKQALPDQYGEILESLDTTASSLSSLYDETIKEIKPQMSRLAKKVDKLVPEESKFFKKLSSKFSEIAGEDYGGYKGKTREEFIEQSVASGLASVFDAQNKIESEEKARQASNDKIESVIEHKRFKSNYGLLTSINENTSRLSQYQDKVTAAYHKKSLELQFRSYFVQSELLKTTTQYMEVFKNQNEAITKNTALPEFVKISNSERFKEIAKGKMIDSFQRGLFGDKDIIKTISDNLRIQLKNVVQGFKEGAEAGLMGLDALEDMRETQRTMAESGIEMPSKYNMLGNIAGSWVGSIISDKISTKARSKIEDGSIIDRQGYKVAEWLSNPSGNLESIKDSEFIKSGQYESGAKGVVSKIANWGLDLLNTKTNVEVGKEGLEGDLHGPSIFTNKTNKTINDIIPGYLARIHRELSILRTGNENTGILRFDYKNEKFVSDKDLANKVKNELTTKMKSGFYSRNIDSAYKRFVGDDETITTDQEKEIKNFLAQLAEKKMRYSPENIYETDIFKNSPIKDIITTKLTKNISLADNEEKGQYEFSKSIKDIRDSMPDIRKEIELYVKQGYADILEDEGLITQNDDGSYKIDFERYKSIVRSSGIVTSDIRAKKNIKSINPKQALNAVKKTKIYNWFYKLGRGDDKNHTGPMAQDVSKNMGKEASPDGTSIDLTTMNGINMAAIQALKEDQDKLNKGDESISILSSIKDDIKTIVELLSKDIVGVDLKSVKGKIDFSKVKSTVTSTAGKIIDFYTDSISFGKDKIAKPIFNILTKSFNNNKDKVTEGFKNIFSKVSSLAGKVLEVSTDFISNKLPLGIKQAKDLFINVKDYIKETLIEYKDVYVKGKTVPLLRANLLKIGYYIDQTTGKVIKSVEDIKGTVVDRHNNVILTAEDVAEGLVDIDGKEIITPFKHILKSIIAKAGNTAIKIKDFYKALGTFSLDKVTSIFKSGSTSLNTDKTYNILVEIRDILKGKSNLDSSGIDSTTSETTETKQEDTETNKPDLSPKYKSNNNMLGSIFNKGKDILSNVKNNIPSIKSAKGFKGKAATFLGSIFSQDKDEESIDNTSKTTSSQVSDYTQEPKDSIKTKVSKTITGLKDKSKAAWNDRDASGRRDGDWRDRLDSLKDKAKDMHNKFKPADLAMKYRSDENVIDKITSMAGGIFSGIKDGIQGLLSKSGGLLETAAETYGLSKSGGFIKGLGNKAANLAKNVGNFVKSPLQALKSGASIAANTGSSILAGAKSAAGTVISGASKLGVPIANTLSKVKNIASVGRVLSVGNTLRNVALVGSALTGGVGSAAMGAIGVGMSAIGAALASPVVLGTAAIAATGYGAYKAYKYITRNNVNIFESIRLKQYGLLNSEYDRHHNSEILELEEYLQDGKIGYDKGKAYLLSKKIDIAKMLSIFSIDPNDTDSLNNFTQWLELRFKPFFLTHLTSLYVVNDKGTLKDIEDLSVTDKSKYLSLIGFESGPYDVTVSPFKDIDKLNTDSKIVFSTINEAMESIKKEMDGKDKSPIDKVLDKIPGVKSIRDSSYWKKKEDDSILKAQDSKNDITESKSVMNTLLNKGTEVVSKTYQETKEVIGKVYDKGTEVVGSIYKQGKETATKAYEKTKEAASAAVDWTSQNIVQPIKDSLSGIIQRAESGNKGYNAYNRGTSGNKILPPVGPRNLTSMTISEILEDSKRPKDDPKRLFAVGKYQMIPDTMRDGIKKLGIDPDTTLYNEATQEHLFSNYLLDKKRPKISAFIKGKSDDSTAALDAAASEWASLPDPRTGVSKYGSGNHASVKLPTLLSALQQSRDLYKQYITEGMPEKEAYQKAISGGGSGTMVSSASTKDTNIPKGGPTIENANQLTIGSDQQKTATGNASSMLAGGPTVENASKSGMTSIVDTVVNNTSTDIQSTNTQVASTDTVKKDIGINSAISIPNSSAAPMQDYVSLDTKPSANTKPAIYEYNQIAPMSVTSRPTSQESGQGFGLGDIDKVINHVGETLDQSLDVQKQMLEVLKQIVTNVNPDNFNQVKEGLTNVANKAKMSTVPEPAVSLSRKSA